MCYIVGPKRSVSQYRIRHTQHGFLPFYIITIFVNLQTNFIYQYPLFFITPDGRTKNAKYSKYTRSNAEEKLYK